jgi:hypothetical protein
LLQIIVSVVGAAASLALSPVAEAQRSTNLTLEVNYDYVGQITVTLPNGTPVGTKSGTPTVIPAGYYTIELNQPGCVDTPTFILQGPGVSVFDNLQNGEVVTDAVSADFRPNSTYTWRSGVNPPVLFTFQTSGDVLGTPPPPTPVVKGPVSTNKQTNTDVVGSGLQAHGMLAGVVTAAGTDGLAFKGKQVTTLTAGRYKVTVTDKSVAHGFVLGSGAHHVVDVTGAQFVGRRSATVTLTVGQWFFAPSVGGKKTYFAVTR